VLTQQRVLQQQLLQWVAPLLLCVTLLPCITLLRCLRGLLLQLLSLQPLRLLLLLCLLLTQHLFALVLLIELLQLLLRVLAACAVDHVLQQLLFNLQEIPCMHNTTFFIAVLDSCR
jgi:hypothetical protein